MQIPNKNNSVARFSIDTLDQDKPDDFSTLVK